MLKPASHVKVTAGTSGAVLLDLRHGKYFSLNAVGFDIWSALVTGAPQTETIKALSTKYSVPEAQILADVVSFCNQLVDRGLACG